MTGAQVRGARQGHLAARGTSLRRGARRARAPGGLGVAEGRALAGEPPVAPGDRYAGCMSHSYTCLCVHFVFSTKDRGALLVEEVRPRLVEYMGGVFRGLRCSQIAAHAMADHVHLLVMVHPSVSAADVMREVKSRSSAFVREAFPDREWAGWQEGYGAFSVSRSGVDEVKAYIARQEEHHRVMTFKEEFEALLQRHGVEYDARYVWG